MSSAPLSQLLPLAAKYSHRALKITHTEDNSRKAIGSKGDRCLVGRVCGRCGRLRGGGHYYIQSIIIYNYYFPIDLFLNLLQYTLVITKYDATPIYCLNITHPRKNYVHIGSLGVAILSVYSNRSVL